MSNNERSVGALPLFTFFPLCWRNSHAPEVGQALPGLVRSAWPWRLQPTSPGRIRGLTFTAGSKTALNSLWYMKIDSTWSHAWLALPISGPVFNSLTIDCRGIWKIWSNLGIKTKGSPLRFPRERDRGFSASPSCPGGQHSIPFPSVLSHLLLLSQLILPAFISHCPVTQRSAPTFHLKWEKRRCAWLAVKCLLPLASPEAVNCHRVTER